jgi:uncharacterized protein YecT (DUF1311 family)
MKASLIALSISFLLCAGFAEAQLSKADPAVQQACAAVMKTPLPTDMVRLPVPVKWPGCDSYAVYATKDYAKARSCAVQERAAVLAHVLGGSWVPRDASGDPSDAQHDPQPTGGLIVLAEMYANGEGVARSPKLVERFVCEAAETGEIDGVENDPEQAKNLLAVLGTIEHATANSAALNFCPATFARDGIPGTLYCEEQWDEERAEMHAGGIQEGIDNAQADADDADAAIEPVLKKFSAGQRAAYDRAAAAMQHFINVQVTGDALFMGGYGSGGLYPNEEHAAFENGVVAAVNSPPSAPTDAAVTAADAELNAVYCKLIAAAALDSGDDHRYDAITEEKLRVEQRAWLAYRDAFVALGRALHPSVPASAWLLQATAARASALQQVYEIDGKAWIADAKKQAEWKRNVMASSDAQTAKNAASVAEFFDHQTAVQAAAWREVQTRLDGFVAAHAAASGRARPFDRNQQLDGLYAELYAIGYNRGHGFKTDAVKAEQGLAANDKRLNEAYQADLADACVFRTPDFPGQIAAFRSPELLRVEERAWLRLRDAWVAFLATLFPDEPRAALANMITGSRTFELDMAETRCKEAKAAGPH